MLKILENRLIEEFKDREYFTRGDLFDFYRHFEPDLKEGTFGWRIYDLKNKNMINILMCRVESLRECEKRITHACR